VPPALLSRTAAPGRGRGRGLQRSHRPRRPCGLIRRRRPPAGRDNDTAGGRGPGPRAARPGPPPYAEAPRLARLTAAVRRDERFARPRPPGRTLSPRPTAGLSLWSDPAPRRRQGPRHPRSRQRLHKSHSTQESAITRLRPAPRTARLVAWRHLLSGGFSGSSGGPMALYHLGSPAAGTNCHPWHSHRPVSSSSPIASVNSATGPRGSRPPPTGPPAPDASGRPRLTKIGPRPSRSGWTCVVVGGRPRRRRNAQIVHQGGARHVAMGISVERFDARRRHRPAYPRWPSGAAGPSSRGVRRRLRGDRGARSDPGRS
jgi:hypothetical protein